MGAARVLSHRWGLALFVIVLMASPAAAPSAEASSPVAPRRFGGASRYETAALIAQSTFSTSTDAILARGDDFPDALAASSLAGQVNGPVLLTPRAELHPAALKALQGLQTRRVFLIGDAGALAANVEAELRSQGFTTERIGGASRYDTATAIAAHDPTVRTLPSRGTAVFLTSGEAFADALAVSPLSYATKVPVLLTRRASLPQETEDLLRARQINRVVIIGGSGAVSTAIEDRLTALQIGHERVAGPDRATTASAVAWWARDVLGWQGAHANLARGDGFADAIAGSAHAGTEQAPVLLAASPTSLGAAAHDYLKANVLSIKSVDFFGDAEALTEPTAQTALTAAGDASGCGTTAYPLDFAAAPDSRVCVTLTLSSHSAKAGEGIITATLTATNRSGEVVDITHPSGCHVWYGLFDGNGRLAGGGQSLCASGSVPDQLSPHETKSWIAEIHTCVGRLGTTGSACIEGATLSGSYIAAAGLNVGRTVGVNADKVWYAATQPVSVTD
jgi:putative cell wall-binding protein